MPGINVNFWAVLVAAIVYIVVGSLWYGPLFGKMWKRMMGFTDETMKSMKLSAVQATVMGFITALIMAYVLANFVVIAGAVGLDGAWQLAFWIWLGFIVTNTAGSFLWEGRPLKLFVLNAVEQLAALFLMAIVLVFLK